MKKFMVILPISAMTLFVSLPKGANAQVAFLEVIKAGVKKVIKAMDLKVQRLQNETIWLQNAQKVLENQLSKLKLGEIAEWTGRQKELYGQYYEELWKVKSAIVQYRRLGELARLQARIVEEYRWAWNLFSRSGHFSAQELLVMEKVYAGILEQSVKNVDGILSVVGSFKTQMSDGERLVLIVQAGETMEQNWQDLKRFNRESGLLSIQRARSLEEAAKLKELYGIDD
ncbi:conjugal transfer protein TraI [Pedobacter namyangjuensis]|uniref:conjugal transfer protein TraI n=1 Tax=Pedobacter namyangjuensis TaxID=600626 RepID=UPI000DE485CB|nr:conjugal transfer protein TraI [Pedobacter namyangjuensis]